MSLFQRFKKMSFQSGQKIICEIACTCKSMIYLYIFGRCFETYYYIKAFFSCF